MKTSKTSIEIQQAAAILGLRGFITSLEAIQTAYDKLCSAWEQGLCDARITRDQLDNARDMLVSAFQEETIRVRRGDYLQIRRYHYQEYQHAQWFQINAQLTAHRETFRFVRPTFEQDGLVVTVDLQAPLVFNDRVLRFLINFLGRSEPNEVAEQVHTPCGTYVRDVRTHSCQIWLDSTAIWFIEGVDLFIELLLLAVRVSQQLSVVTAPAVEEIPNYRLEDLVSLECEKDQMLRAYETFIHHVIARGDDDLKPTCDLALSERWLCCPTHRFVFAQRLALNDRLDFLLRRKPAQIIEEGEGWNDDTCVHTLPSQDEILRYVSAVLASPYTPQSWMESYIRYATHREEEHWGRPHVSCARSAFISWHCCSFHRALQVIWNMHSIWLGHFAQKYHLSQYVHEEGYPSAIGSPNSLALLCHLAGVNLSTITFPKWLEGIPAIDISIFHRLEPMWEQA